MIRSIADTTNDALFFININNYGFVLKANFFVLINKNESISQSQEGSDSGSDPSVFNFICRHLEKHDEIR